MQIKSILLFLAAVLCAFAAFICLIMIFKILLMAIEHNVIWLLLALLCAVAIFAFAACGMWIDKKIGDERVYAKKSNIS